MNQLTKSLFAFLAIAICVANAGCESFTTGTSASKKKKKDASWFSFKKKEYQIPQTMNVTWSHDILTLPGKPATRGFGGRFYFYNEKTHAIPVDGDLVVYGFDDTGKTYRSEDLSQAEKRFRFTAEQFTTHFTEGELGASYSVWIPWDEAYGMQKKIMLIPTFMTKDGRIIRGAAASLNLPGKGAQEQNEGLMPPTSTIIPTALPGQLADARQKLPNAPSSSGMRTTTIQVPTNSLKNHAVSPEAMAAISNIQNMSQPQFANDNIFFTSSAAQSQSGFSRQQNLDRFSNVQATPNTIDSQAPLASSPPSKSTQLEQHSFFSQPTSIPTMRSNVAANNPNGWVLPEFSQGPYSGLTPHSAPSQLPVPTSQGVQPASYQTR